MSTMKTIKLSETIQKQVVEYITLR